jgi:hypothetical protein
MRFIDRSKVSAPQLEELKAKGEAAADDLLKQFNATGEVKINRTLYGSFKDFLFQLTDRKCAYCEQVITSNQPGEVEHFRPKGSVVDDKFKPIFVVHPKRGKIEHPGYFWLAYEWLNLLPSCIDCNRYRLHQTFDEKSAAVKEGAGKADRFPLADETKRACVPQEVSLEDPLLIDPSRVSPDGHFKFCRNGMIKPLTDYGVKTVEIFGLNLREDLVRARQEAYDSANDAVEQYWSKLRSEKAKARELAMRINTMAAGRGPHTVMQMMALEEFRSDVRDAGYEMMFPLPLPKPAVADAPVT